MLTKYRSGIIDTEIKVMNYLTQLNHPQSGGVVTFIGQVRNHNDGKNVAYLDYETYTAMSIKMIENIVDSSICKWKLNTALCVHRIGRLPIGEIAVLVITSAPHRDEAYRANREIIDEVKHHVPIWKREVFVDGTYKWSDGCL